MAVYSYAQNLYITEKAVEDDAMNVKEAERYYKKLVKKATDTAETKEQIDQTIKELKTAVKQMQEELDKVKKGQNTEGKQKYIMKAMIPFNGVWRTIKRNDPLAVISDISYILGVSVRCVNYGPMLERNIKVTEEAIDYLEKKKKELK